MAALLTLFATFFRIGVFTFGGGYAMISIIEDICVNKRKWITHEELLQMTVIAESTPGPIAINCATYVGQKQGGFAGSVAATVGIVLPSFVIIYLISTVLDGFLEIPMVAGAFRGIRIGVGLLILRVGVNMALKMPRRKLPRAIALGAGSVMLVSQLLDLKISSITLMVLCGALSLVLFRLGEQKGGEQV